MEILLKEENGIICIALKGRLDAESADEADRAIRDILAGDNFSLLFDLSALEYLSSSGLRIILNTTRELKQKQGKMVLCALNIFVKEIFEERDFPVVDSVNTGLRALR
jgi:anti-anti-sigma factor